MQYLQMEEIGRGGMGVVYKAYCPDLKRRVVLKKVHPALAVDPAYQNQIKKEAQLLSRLKHPNIVSYIGCDLIESNHQTEFCLIMEYIEGINLKEWLRLRGSLPFEKLVPMFLDLCGALAYLHQNRIFHFDLKPENILMTIEEKLFLTDFGISSIESGNGNTAPLDNPIGSLEYIAPEQLKGESPGGRSDLYSLGMVLHALLNGKGFFEGAEKQVIWGKLLYDTSPFNLAFSEEVPGFFQDIIRKLVSKASSDRFQTVEALLHEFHLHYSTSKAPVSLPAKKFKMPDRRYSEKWLILAAGVFFVFILFLFSSLGPRNLPLPSRTLPSPENSSEINTRRGEPAASPETGSMMTTAGPVIQIASLEKENQNEVSLSDDTPFQTLNDDALERFLLEFKTNVENKNLEYLRETIHFSADQFSQFRKKIEIDSKIKVTFIQIKREGVSITVHYQLLSDQNGMYPPVRYVPGVNEESLFFRMGAWQME
ncbi:MAG: serine/threonine-protein kinase [Nitrospiria bacterium]